MDDDRSDLERRLLAQAEYIRADARGEAGRLLREAAGRIGEARRVLDLLTGPPLDAAGVVELIGLAMTLRAKLGGDIKCS